mgnify:CR=1 FL=1
MGLMMNVPTKDYIVETIKEEILSGQIKPGTELAQEALAERLGVSRMPIREALQKFSAGGLCGQTSQPAYAGSGIRQRTDPRCISYD